MKTALVFLLSISLTAAAAPKTDVSLPAVTKPVAEDFANRMVSSKAVPAVFKKELKDLIERMTADQPRLPQMFPLATSADVDGPLTLEEKTRELAGQFATTVRTAQQALALGNEAALRLSTNEAVAILARVYALSNANSGNRLQLGLWVSHARGILTGALALTLLYQLNEMRLAEVVDHYRTNLVAILVLLIGGSLWDARGDGGKLNGDSPRLRALEAFIPKFHLRRVARANVEFFWREVMALVDVNDAFKTPEHLLGYLAMAAPEHTLSSACENAILTAASPSSTPLVR